MSKKTLIVGDVHGCSAELSALVRACDLGPQDDLVLVGDLVAKGPASAEVIALCRAWNARSVMGNHDHALVMYHQARARGETPRLRRHQAEALESLSEADVRYLQALPLWLALPEYDALVVHAGLVPGVPLTEQDPEMLLNMRTLDAQGQGSTRWNAGPLWASRYRGPPFVYFGHNARAGLQHHPHALGLDTGCVYGGALTGCVLPEGRLVGVRAARAYVEKRSSG